MKRVLISWIGRTDLRAAAGEIEGMGPIASAVCQERFDEIVLLSNYRKAEAEPFVGWLRSQSDTAIRLTIASLSSPMDFGEVYEAADHCAKQVAALGPVQMTFHLSPGTSAMCAMWLILATTKYDANLLASSLESGVYAPEFPFEIAADYVPRKAAATKSRVVTAAFEEGTPAAFQDIVHRCDAMKRVIDRAQRVAQFDVPVMILGESGTGKDLFARAIHNASPRSNGPYVVVNCGALPKELAESELFGHRKGAFTGAYEDRAGRFAQANRGTLFLDELGELPSDLQVKLLRVVEDGQVTPVGGTGATPVDVRVISATNRVLPTEIREGRFREDLFHRLALGILNLPPLRERSEDLKLLIEAKLSVLASTLKFEADWTVPRLSAGAKAVISRYSWPGNIRELFNALTRAVIWCSGEKVSREDMTDSLALPATADLFSVDDIALGNGFQLDDFLQSVKVKLVRKAQAMTSKQKDTAELLGITDSNLRQKLKKINSDK